MAERFTYNSERYTRYAATMETTNVKTRRYLLAALLAAGTATLVIALLRRFPRNFSPP